MSGYLIFLCMIAAISLIVGVIAILEDRDNENSNYHTHDWGMWEVTPDDLFQRRYCITCGYTQEEEI